MSAAVTDVLVERGDLRVVRAVTENDGARFSDAGFGKLVARARIDDTLARDVGMRCDIPRYHFIKLQHEHLLLELVVRDRDPHERKPPLGDLIRGVGLETGRLGCAVTRK